MYKIKKNEFELDILHNNKYYLIKKTTNGEIFLNKLVQKNDLRVCKSCNKKVRLMKVKQDWVCPVCFKRCRTPAPKIYK